MVAQGKLNRMYKQTRSSLRMSIARVKHRGHEERCPMCRASIRRYLPHGLDHPVLEQLDIVGGGRREHARCPVCLCTDRERLVYLYLKHVSGTLGTACDVLHIAPELSLERLMQSQEQIQYLTGDLQSPDVMMELDLCNLKLEDNSFDVVLCNHVLEHIPEDMKAMREIHRVLRPNGFAVLQTPISHSLDQTLEDPAVTTDAQREATYGQWDHVRVYARDYAERLRAAGFRVEIIDWTGEPGLRELGKRYRLNPREMLYVAHRTH